MRKPMFLALCITVALAGCAYPVPMYYQAASVGTVQQAPVAPPVVYVAPPIYYYPPVYGYSPYSWGPPIGFSFRFGGGYRGRR